MLTTYNPHQAIIDAADLQPTTKHQYKRAVDNLIKAGIDPRNTNDLALYAGKLSSSSKAFLKSALRLLFADTATRLKMGANVDNLAEVQAALLNLDAMTETIKVQAQNGKRAAIWLSPQQVEGITSLPDRNTVSGRRDWIVLSTVLGAGLRRSEMASLTFDNLKRQPKKNGQLRGVLEILGKGAKFRTVPIKPLLEERIKEWHKEAGDGLVARSVNKAGTINGSLSDKAVNDIFHRYGSLIGLPELEAHDGRRTWAQLGLNAGIPIQQISTLLGHSNIAVTQKYLDLQIDLNVTISDFVPLSE